MVMINNLVIEGDYKGKVINQVMDKPYVQVGLIKSMDIIPANMESFNLNPTIHSGAAKAAKAKGLKLVELHFKKGTYAIGAVNNKMYNLIKKSLHTPAPVKPNDGIRD